MPILSRQQMAPPPDNAYCQENNQAEILGLTGAFFTVAIIIVGLRMVVRGVMIKSVWADDYVMLSALAMAMATFVSFVYETKYAVGKHLQCIPQDDYEVFARWQYFHSLWVMIGVALVKISIAFFLMRLVPPGKKWKRFLWACISETVRSQRLRALANAVTSILGLLLPLVSGHVDLQLYPDRSILGLRPASQAEHELLLGRYIHRDRSLQQLSQLCN